MGMKKTTRRQWKSIRRRRLALALAGALRAGGPAWLCAAALCLCACADVLLEMNFLLGMVVFMGGHGCYIAWFLTRGALGATHLWAFAALLATASLLLWHWSGQLKGRLLPFALYATVLCVMGGCGIATGLSAGTAAGLMMAAGALCFALSDAMVCRGVLGPVTRPFDYGTMILYDSAQLLLGLSCALA